MRNVQRTSYARRIKGLSNERARLQRELREARAEAKLLQGKVYDWEYRYGLLSQTEELRRRNRVRSLESKETECERLRAELSEHRALPK